MSLINVGREFDKKHLVGPRQFYIGVVINNNDPLKLQRIKLRIHDLHRNVSDNALPWCLPFTALLSSNVQIGQMGPIPTLGSRVYMTYIDDSLYFPVYFGGVVAEDRKLDDFTGEDSSLTEDYPNVYGWIDRSGNRFVVNTVKHHLEFTHISGTRINIDGKGYTQIDIADREVDGSIDHNTKGLTINIKGHLNVNVEEDMNIKVGGNLTYDVTGNTKIKSNGFTNIDSTNNINVRGSQVHLNSSSPESASSVPDMTFVERDKPEETPLTEDHIYY